MPGPEKPTQLPAVPLVAVPREVITSWQPDDLDLRVKGDRPTPSNEVS